MGVDLTPRVYSLRQCARVLREDYGRLKARVEETGEVWPGVRAVRRGERWIVAIAALDAGLRDTYRPTPSRMALYEIPTTKTTNAPGEDSGAPATARVSVRHTGV